MQEDGFGPISLFGNPGGAAAEISAAQSAARQSPLRKATPLIDELLCPGAASFEVAPVGAEGQIGDERDFELYHALHLGADQRGDLFGFSKRNLEE